MPKTVEKTKPGPKPGTLTETNVCPYCGGTAHRKAVQKLKGEPKAYRRMYCANGCGHYHYRDIKTNEVVEVGAGPRVPDFYRTPDTEDRQADKQFIGVVSRLLGEKDYNLLIERLSEVLNGVVESTEPFEVKLADALGIDVASLRFTADDGKGRPRALVNCLSDADIALLPTEEDRETVERLHRALLATQACIKVYKDRVPKGRK